MKYWRGFLIAAILGGFSWALMAFADSHQKLIDMVYPYLVRFIQDYLANWSGTVSFCLWQVLALVLVVGVLASIVLMIVLRWNPIQVIGWYTAVASFLFFGYTALYGVNGSAGPLAEDIRLTVSGFTVQELEEATIYYRDKANDLATQVKRKADGRVDYPDFETLALQAEDGFTSLVYDYSYAVFAGNTSPVKQLGWADMYTSMGITGFTMPLTGEAAVNAQIPAVGLPFTMCHEMAHRMAITKEQDANMAAFLACQANSSVDFQYSGYLMAYRYCYSALAKINTDEAKAAVQRVRGGMNDSLYGDIADWDNFFLSKRNETSTKVATVINDTSIKVSGDERGVASYGEVYTLLVYWHLDQVVRPAQVVEVTKFDPFDENLVDLTGYVNGPTPETTPPEE